MKIKDSFDYRRYKLYRDKLNHLIKNDKRKYYDNYFLNNTNGMRKIYIYIFFL